MNQEIVKKIEKGLKQFFASIRSSDDDGDDFAIIVVGFSVRIVGIYLFLYKNPK